MWQRKEAIRNFRLLWLAVAVNALLSSTVSGDGDGDIANYIRKCCISGLRHARVEKACVKYDNAVASIPPLWLGLCHSTFGVCCSRETEKQSCEMGRLAALAGSRCDELHNSTAYADCCRACQVGLAVKASEKNCKDPLFSYFGGIESYRTCCQDGDGIASVEAENEQEDEQRAEATAAVQQKPASKESEHENGADGTIVLSDDDDICSKIPNLCEQICENTYSAYECKCHPGYKLNENKVTCTAIESDDADQNDKRPSPNEDISGEADDVVDEEAEDDDGDGDSDSDFNKTSAVCPSGYAYDAAKRKCVDIDECTLKLHECKARQYCHNTIGGYRCLNVKEKKCGSGYRYSSDTDKCVDYDECEDSPCEAGYQCSNYLGGYECTKSTNCEAGFQLKNGHCVDVDECVADAHACDSTQVCANTIGSYHCACKIGFNLDGSNNGCVDINECSINNHNCLPTQRCDNTIGSYICTRLQSCGTGYTLNAENGECDDDDECALNTHNCPADYECFNMKGSFRCYRRTTTTTTTTTTLPPTTTTTTSRSTTTTTQSSYWQPWLRQTQSRTEYTPNYITGDLHREPCALGFQRNQLGACTDINECRLATLPCGSHQRCINTNGSYRCENLLQCAAGFKSTPDGSSCMDVDECATGEHNCADNQVCSNRQGGFICACPAGHQLTRLANGANRCVDINECVPERNGPAVCPSNANCLNTIGSYYCECKSGFQKKSGESEHAHAQCYDVDECQAIAGLCQQKCVNFWGGYRCTCNAGYELSADNRTCNDIDECEVHKTYKLCMGYCNNVPGSYECSCPRGYTLAADKNTCRDIDECETSDVCTGRYDICTNIRGYYKCTTISCPYGYINDPEQKNRCRQVSNYCENDDCYNKPSAYTYNFITLVSQLMMPPEGRTIFTLRGPAWYDDIDFDLKILRIQAAPNIEKASESHFDTFKGHNQVNLILKRSLEGPQDVELELSMTVFTNGMPRGKSVGKIFIFVSQYTF